MCVQLFSNLLKSLRFSYSLRINLTPCRLKISTSLFLWLSLHLRNRAPNQDSVQRAKGCLKSGHICASAGAKFDLETGPNILFDNALIHLPTLLNPPSAEIATTRRNAITLPDHQSRQNVFAFSVVHTSN